MILNFCWHYLSPECELCKRTTLAIWYRIHFKCNVFENRNKSFIWRMNHQNLDTAIHTYVYLRPLWALLSWDSDSSNHGRICPISMCVLCWYDKCRLMQWTSLLRHTSPEQHSVCMHWLEVGICKSDFLQQKYICIYFIPLYRYGSYQYAYQQYAL